MFLGQQIFETAVFSVQHSIVQIQGFAFKVSVAVAELKASVKACVWLVG